jgi:outer membrane protein assembly factor BamB
MGIDLKRSATRRDFLKSSAAAAAAAGVWKPAFAADDAASPAADAWPNFRNGLHLHGIARTTLPENPELKWELESPDGCKSTPAIVDGRVYVAGLSGELQCLSLADGKPQWSYRSRETEDPKSFIPGFSSPVTVTAKSVLCGDEEGTLHCLDRRTGEKQWLFESEGLVVGAAAVVGERVIFGSHSQFLYGLDYATGKKLWEFDAKGPVNGSQAFAGNYTFVTGCSEPLLYVVDITTGKQETQVPIEDLLIATPALMDDVLYFGTSEGLVMAVDWKKQSTIWKFETRQPREMHSAPATTDDKVLIAARDKSLYCLDRQKGTQLWAFPTRAANDNSPIVVGDRAFFGSGDKFLYAVGLDDGKERWKFSAGRPFSDSSPVAAEGRLVVCTEGPQGRILCFG